MNSRCLWTIEAPLAEDKKSYFSKDTVEVEQACFLPGSDDNVPVIGRLKTAANAYIACGHTCWGILNAPATGLALARLLVHGDDKGVVDLAPFAPGRPVQKCNQQ